jgi:Uma2 family endonuclease
MPVKIAIAQIQINPGQRVTLDNISWPEFEAILEELGEHRHSHIAYYQGVLEFRMPLPGHERTKVLISHLLVVLLDALELEWESLGSTTFKRQTMQAGIEPDDCFYIRNYAAVIGKQRLDLEVDPVPDLAIEVDLTSFTQTSAYRGLGIPELWRIDQGRLEIWVLENGQYQSVSQSRLFPTLPIVEGFSLFLAKSQEQPVSELRREFKQWLQDYL